MESTTPVPEAMPSGYPMTLEIPRPERQSRLTNFPAGIGLVIRYLLLIPHFVILWFLTLAAGVVGFIADFAILFTGNYPRGLFDFTLGVQRWTVNVSAYLFSLRDEYPPFSMDAGQYPVTYNVEYPASLNRILNFPFLRLYIKMILLIASHRPAVPVRSSLRRRADCPLCDPVYGLISGGNAQLFDGSPALEPANHGLPGFDDGPVPTLQHEVGPSRGSIAGLGGC